MQMLNVDFTNVESSDITKSFLSACLISFLVFISLNYVLIYGLNVYAEHPSKVYLFDHKHYLNIATIVVVFFILPLAYFITSKAQDSKPYRFWFCCSIPAVVLLTALVMLPIYTLLVPVTSHDRNMDYWDQFGYIFSTNKLFIALIVVSVFYFVIEITRLRDHKKNNVDTTFGGAKEADITDLRKHDLLVPKKQEVITSENKYICYGELNRRMVGSTIGRNTCTFAPPRTGKATTSLIPRALECPYPMFFNDIKSELAQVLVEHRAKYFGKKAIIIDPLNEILNYNAAKWAKYQTLHIDLCNIGIDIDPNMYSSVLAEAIALDDPSQGRNKSFYDDAKDIITGILFYLVSEKRNIFELFDLVVKKGLKSAKAILSQYNKSLEEDSEVILLAIRKISQLFGPDGLTTYGQGVEGNIISAVKIFGRPDIKSMFSKGQPDRTFDIKDFLLGNADIYLIIPTSMVKQTAAFTRLVMGMVRSAMEFAPSQMLEAEYYVWALDEIVQTDCFELVEQMYEILQFKKNRFWLYFQNMDQLKKFSKPEMIKEFDVLQFFEVNGDKTIEFIKNFAGTKTVEVESIGKRKKDKDKSTNTSKTRTELLPVDKIRELPADQQIIFHKGCPVILCDRTKYYEHRRYKGLAAENLTRTDDKKIQALIPADNEEVKSRILQERKNANKQKQQNNLVKDKNAIKKHLLAKLKKEKKEELITFKAIDDNYYITDKMFVVCIDADLDFEIEKADKYLKMLLEEGFLTPESIDDEVIYKIDK